MQDGEDDGSREARAHDTGTGALGGAQKGVGVNAGQMSSEAPI